MNQITLYIIGALAVAAAGLFTYHKLVVSKQATEITKLTNENKQLKTDVAAATSANESLDKEVKRIAAQTDQLVTILKTVQEKDAKAAEWFDDARKALGNQVTADELMKRLKEKPDEVVDSLNKDIDCTIAHFGQLGVCKDGIFVPYVKQ